MSNADELLDLATRLTAQNTNAVFVVGARSIVLTRFLDAVLPYLTHSQGVMVSQSFRKDIDDVLSLMDGSPMPLEHQAAMLEMTNSILEALKKK